MSIVLRIPSFQIEVGVVWTCEGQKRQKLENASFTFIDNLFTNHIEILSQMASEGFINLIRFVVLGIDSFGESCGNRGDSCRR